MPPLPATAHAVAGPTPLPDLRPGCRVCVCPGAARVKPPPKAPAPCPVPPRVRERTRARAQGPLATTGQARPSPAAPPPGTRASDGLCRLHGTVQNERSRLQGLPAPPKARAALGPGRSRHSPEPSPSPALAPPTDAQVGDTGQDLAPAPRRQRGSCKLQGRPPPSVASDTAPPKAGAGAWWP